MIAGDPFIDRAACAIAANPGQRGPDTGDAIGDGRGVGARAVSGLAQQVTAEIAEQEDVTGADATVALPVGPTVPAPAPPETFREAKAAELAQSAHGQCSDRYTSGAIFGAATLKGGLHAFVFDAVRGTERTVKVGDTLPGGLTVTSISTENGVIISEAGETRPLAQALTAPAFDDGGGLLFETVGLADVYKPDDSQNGDWEALE